jgi:hypothetical protein
MSSFNIRCSGSGVYFGQSIACLGCAASRSAVCRGRSVLPCRMSAASMPRSRGGTVPRTRTQPGPSPMVDGKKITTLTTATIDFFEKIGLGPVEVGNVIIVEGDTIKSFLPDYPSRAVARIDEPCREQGAGAPFFGRTCADFVGGARAHTAHLIAEGIVGKELYQRHRAPDPPMRANCRETGASRQA